MESRTESTTPKSQTAALVALALLGPLFGIATQVWGQALLLLGLAALLIFVPPRRSPSAAWCLLFLAILGIALTAFLPLRWFAVPEWRRTLTEDFRVVLPDTLSPQPWVSLHAACLLFAGLVFALYLTTQTWDSQSRRLGARWYSGGIVLLAVLALASLEFGWHVPIWPRVLNSMTGFGIFPNRNQTANVFALAGIMATALAFDGFKRRQKGAWFWTASVIVFGTAIVKTYSRAGVLLFFGGIATWALLSFARRGSRPGSRKGGALTLAGFALLLTAYFVFGGGSFERFQNLGQDTRVDYRIGIQKDALHLTASAPWLGQGLGNFAPVFAMARVVSADQNRAIHPESDWLWIAVEMGWPAAVLFAVAFFLWLRQCLPLSRGSDRALRSAAMVCGVAFALHSFGDVSGHRPGSVWPALFLAGLAMHPRRSIGRHGWPAPVFRMFGVMLALIASWWFASIFSERVGHAAPTLATVARLAERIERENRQKEYDSALADTNDALRIMPLDADLYYQRGIARVAEAFSVWGAAWDFGTARYLEPRWAELCFEEGKAWVDAGRADLAFDAWVEALRRAGSKGPGLYYQMLHWTGNRLGLHSALGRLAHASPDYFLVFIRHAERLESDLLIRQLIQAEPKLTSFSGTQRSELFSIWMRQGDHGLLFSTLLGNPEWQKEGWRWLASLYAERKDYQRACEIARDSSPRPKMPKIIINKSPADLERIFRNRPDDIDAGLQLYTSQVSLGKKKDALETLQMLQAIPNHPAYLDFIEAELHEEYEQWELSWKAWLRFGGRDFQ